MTTPLHQLVVQTAALSAFTASINSLKYDKHELLESAVLTQKHLFLPMSAGRPMLKDSDFTAEENKRLIEIVQTYVKEKGFSSDGLSLYQSIASLVYLRLQPNEL
jgi:hypothetical protein